MRAQSWIKWIGATVVAYAVGLTFSTWIVGATARSLSPWLGGLVYVAVFGAAIGLVVGVVQYVALPRGAVSWRAWVAATVLGAAVGVTVASVVGELLGNLIDPTVNLVVGEGTIQDTSGAIVGLGIGVAQWLVVRRSLHVGRGWIVAAAVGAALGYGSAAAILELFEIAPLKAVLVPSFGAILGAFVGVAQALVLRSRGRV